MATIEQQTGAILADSGPVLVYRQGWRGDLVLTFNDQNGDAVNLTPYTLTAEGEWYNGTVTAASTTGMEIISGSSKIDLTSKITKNSDQAASPGAVFSIDSDVEYSDNIDANATVIPQLLVYLKAAIGAAQVRVYVFRIAWRRGKAADG